MSECVISIQISRVLAMMTNGMYKFEVTGQTVGDALNELFHVAPQLRVHMLDDAGSLRPHILIYVGDLDIRWTGGFDTSLTNRDEINVLQAVSGG